MSIENINRLGKVIVVGVAGSIGRVIATKIAEAQSEVIGIDKSEKIPALVFDNIIFRTDDILHPGKITISDLAEADTIIFAVSHQIITAALPVILSHIKPTCLLVDTLSIKTPFLKLIEDSKVSQQVMGINPMFSGDLDPQGRPIAVVIYNNGETVKEFLALLQTWDLQVVLMDVHEHDRVMGVLQSLGHALLIAFGKTVVEAKVDPLLISTLAPPPFRLLLTLLARLTQNHPDVYWEIQADNPYAKQYRDSLLKSLIQLDSTIATGSKNDFNADLTSFSAELIDELPEFLQLSRKIFEFTHQNRNLHKQHAEETIE